jgi:ATP-dependent 26S proteasome regulatory subunit
MGYQAGDKIACANHSARTSRKEKLDAVILDRPSRFDRKYYFELPAAGERLAYIELWNQSLEAQLRLSPAALPRLVKQSKGFAFAYLKELFLSGGWQPLGMPDWTMLCCTGQRFCAGGKP